MKEIIGLEHVSLRLGNTFSIKDLTFQVMPGEIFGFLGPSGAGKTTTLKLLTRQLKADTGKIRLLGKAVEDMGREEYDAIGILSDTSALYERMTIAENLKFFAKLRNVEEQKAELVMKSVGLYESGKTLIKKCSKGMKQRAVLAASLLHHPRILFLDEPTSGLDPGTAHEIHRLLKRLNQEGTTVFLTTHNMEEADKLCGRIGILNQGQLIAIGVPEELKLQHGKAEIEILTTEGKKISVGNDEAGAEKIRQVIAAGQCAALHSQEPDLEELFLKLTGREFE